ncbi:MAG: AAA family ATPase, partial [Gemmataceae bacterium]
LLADEINGATPLTQSALLESMAERQVTVDNVRYPLSATFFVIATQNPVEHHGTYPLPEAQLDRFCMKMSIGYPNKADEMQMLESAVGVLDRNGQATQSVLKENELADLQQQVANVAVEALVREYLVELGSLTRGHSQISLGLSPRGLLAWQRAAQARAFLEGRDFVIPDDIQDVAIPVLGVRLGLEPDTSSRVLSDILASVKVPVQR